MKPQRLFFQEFEGGEDGVKSGEIFLGGWWADELKVDEKIAGFGQDLAE